MSSRTFQAQSRASTPSRRRGPRKPRPSTTNTRKEKENLLISPQSPIRRQNLPPDRLRYQISHPSLCSQRCLRCYATPTGPGFVPFFPSQGPHLSRPSPNRASRSTLILLLPLHGGGNFSVNMADASSPAVSISLTLSRRASPPLPNQTRLHPSIHRLPATPLSSDRSAPARSLPPQLRSICSGSLAR